ncbi:histidine kinase, partial [Streptomyces sp. NPDC018031]
TGQFARPELGQGPGDTGQYPQPQLGQDPSETAQFARPELGQGPGDTGQFPQPQLGQDPSRTGQFARPEPGQGPGDTGQYPQPRLGDTGTHRLQGGPGDTGQFARPELGQGPGDTGQYPQPQLGQDPSETGQFARPEPGAQRSAPTGGYLPQGGPGVGLGGRPQTDTGQFPVASEPADALTGKLEALPPSGPGDDRTPIFDTIESNWFRGARGGTDGRGIPVPDRESAPSGDVPSPVSEDRHREPQASPAGGPANTAAPEWRASPNDERWRRAEQVRVPAAGGITASGLPRRVPRANLVEGTAQQQPQQTGPQVSRAPDDVRGRLTNLRRGIQQGRQAGTGPDGNQDRGLGPTYQQER